MFAMAQQALSLLRAILEELKAIHASQRQMDDFMHKLNGRSELPRWGS